MIFNELSSGQWGNLADIRIQQTVLWSDSENEDCTVALAACNSMEIVISFELENADSVYSIMSNKRAVLILIYDDISQRSNFFGLLLGLYTSTIHIYTSQGLDNNRFTTL